MKKLMIAAAIVCAAIASQASSVNWSSGANKAYFFDTDTLAGNGSYAVSSTLMKDAGYTFAYVLSVADVADANGTVAFNSYLGSFQNLGIKVGGTGAIAVGTTYNYLITITTSLSDIGKVGEWDYSSAVATATLSGTFKGLNGASSLVSGVPTTWTVSGAEPIPEPTSGLLLLLGVAGLALKRKQK